MQFPRALYNSFASLLFAISFQKCKIDYIAPDYHTRIVQSSLFLSVWHKAFTLRLSVQICAESAWCTWPTRFLKMRTTLAVLLLIQGVFVIVQAAVPALFIFGDSMVDSGNNNVLTTIAKADFSPYGRDFDEHKPTGRFANGRLIPDFIASSLGIPFQPPYATAGDDIDHGVNFASAGSGILESTGSVFGQVTSLPKQVQKFGEYKQKLTKKFGASHASNIISKSIVYITAGSNDIVNNYYVLPGSPIQLMYTPERFRQLLIQNYQDQIKAMYDIGARKFVLASLTALGCSPINLLRYNVVKKGDCVNFLNKDAQDFNEAMKTHIVQEQSPNLPGATIIYADSYNYIEAAVKNPEAYGYKVSDKSCCSGIGKNGAIVFCLRNVPTCKDASEYVYWDEFHPSSTAYGHLADNFMNGDTEHAFPINIGQLAAL